MKGIGETIKLIIKERKEPAEKIKELDLGGERIGQITPEVKTLLEKFKNLECLVLSECDISSLDNLPQLPHIQDLDLSSNNLTDSEIKKIAIYPKLVSLNIADNKISKLQTVKSLKNHLKDLENLDCADNKIQELPDYFKAIFKAFPKLKALDNKDKNGEEIQVLGDFQDDQFEDDEEEGQDGEDKEKWEKEGEDSDDDEQFQEDGEQQEGQSAQEA